MTPDIKFVGNGDGQPSRTSSRDELVFSEHGIDTMCHFYGVRRHHFERMLQRGYSRIIFGQGQLGYADDVTGEYVVAFAAFKKEDSDEITTFEVRKNKETFGNVTQGLSERQYSPTTLAEIQNKFRLILVAEDLEAFVRRFAWPRG